MKKSSQAVSESAAFTVTIGGVDLCLTPRCNTLLTQDSALSIDNPSCLVATIIGSSNLGSRSENLDLESNCILIFNDTMKHNNDDTVKKSVSAEWNQLCEHSNELSDLNVDVSSNNILMHFLLKFMRRYL